MTTKKTWGCFTFPAMILIAAISSVFVKAFLSISLFIAFVLVLLTISTLLGFIERKEHNRSSWRYLLYSIFFIGFLLEMRYMITPIPRSTPIPKTNISETIYREVVIEQGDSVMLLSQKRKWNDNFGNTFEGNFSIREKDYTSSQKEYFNNYKKYYKLPWGDLYKYLATSDAPRLDLILKQLKKIKTTHNLNKFEFADMVVTFIQDIPYALVFESACKSAEQYKGYIRDVLEKCSDCCIGYIPHGIQTPIGFMGNLKGDCDTRTVLIYTILNHFGYDIAILNSNYYQHSILGLHIPAKGQYKGHNGKRYYVWETTSKYYTIGTLPNSFNDINHWYIVLTNT